MLCYCGGLFMGAYLLRSTYLLGAFMAGFSFVHVKGSREAWEDHMGPFEAALSGQQ